MPQVTVIPAKQSTDPSQTFMSGFSTILGIFAERQRSQLLLSQQVLEGKRLELTGQQLDLQRESQAFAEEMQTRQAGQNDVRLGQGQQELDLREKELPSLVGYRKSASGLTDVQASALAQDTTQDALLFEQGQKEQAEINEFARQFFPPELAQHGPSAMVGKLELAHKIRDAKVATSQQTALADALQMKNQSDQIDLNRKINMIGPDLNLALARNSAEVAEAERKKKVEVEMGTFLIEPPPREPFTGITLVDSLLKAGNVQGAAEVFSAASTDQYGKRMWDVEASKKLFEQTEGFKVPTSNLDKDGLGGVVVPKVVMKPTVQAAFANLQPETVTWSPQKIDRATIPPNFPLPIVDVVDYVAVNPEISNAIFAKVKDAKLTGQKNAFKEFRAKMPQTTYPNLSDKHAWDPTVTAGEFRKSHMAYRPGRSDEGVEGPGTKSLMDAIKQSDRALTNEEAGMWKGMLKWDDDPNATVSQQYVYEYLVGELWKSTFRQLTTPPGRKVAGNDPVEVMEQFKKLGIGLTEKQKEKLGGLQLYYTNAGTRPWSVN